MFSVQVTLPGEGQSFAWMYSIEDPAGDSRFCGCGAQVAVDVLQQPLTPLLPHDKTAVSQCLWQYQLLTFAQVMGPNKAYLVQHTDNTRIFWADKHELVLGACFKGKTGAVPKQLLDGVSTPAHQLLFCIHAASAMVSTSYGCRIDSQEQ